MTMKFKSLDAGLSSIDDETIVTCSTGGTDRAGDIVVQAGIDLNNYRRNPVVLWAHDPRTPIARAIEIGVVSGKLTARVKWPAPGISAKADEVRGLVKAGIISAVSIGFNPLESEPLEKDRPWGPQKYVRSELGEFSFVSIPANADALVVQRALVTGPATNHDIGRARRLRDLDLLTVTAPAVITRADRLAVAREMDAQHLYRMRP